MSKVFKTRTGVLKLLISFFLIITVILSFPVYLFTKSNLQEVKHREAQIFVDSAKSDYYKKTEVLETLNDTLNEFMYLKLLSTAEEIKESESVNRDFLISLAREQNVTGIWLIEEDGFVRISTEGKVMNATKWYPETDRPDVDWEETLAYLMSKDGAYWIDPKFSARHTPPHDIFKWGYMGIGDVKNVGKVVLEIGVSIEDILSNEALVRDNMVNYNQGTGITNVKLIRADPSKKTNNFVNKSVDNEDGTVTTYFKIEDKLIDSTSQLVITTEHKDIENVETIMLALIVFAPFAVLIMCLVMLYTISRKGRH